MEINLKQKVDWSFDKGWLKVPKGLEKKELKEILKRTQKNIDDCKIALRNPNLNEITIGFLEACKEDWMEKKKKINGQLEFRDKIHELGSLKKAKEYPMEQLLEFNNQGFVSCPFHGPEHTPSAKLYRERNKIHCFGCGVDADTIDVYQKINNVEFNIAVQALCPKNQS